MNRTPRSSSRRVISNWRPCVPDPYMARIGSRLAADVEGLGRLGLHPVGQLERLDPRLEGRVVAAAGRVQCVEPVHQVELPPLGLGALGVVADVLDELGHVGMLGVDVRALERAGQEPRPPVLDAHDRQPAGAHGDEAGQVLILRAQAVGDPRAHAGPGLPPLAAVHQHQRRLMIGHVGVHRADDAEVVGVRTGGSGEQLADLQTALPVPAKLERRAHGGAGLALGAEVGARQRLSVVLRQQGLGVERVDVRRAAVHEQVDDLLGPGGELGRPRGQGIERIGRRRARPRRGERSEPAVVGQHARQADEAEAHAAAVEDLATGEEGVVGVELRYRGHHGGDSRVSACGSMGVLCNIDPSQESQDGSIGASRRS